MQAVILAAGKSTRTYPLTLTRPKPLLKIANKTLLEHNLDSLNGIVDEVILVVGYKKEMIKKYFGKKYKKIEIKYVEQKQQLGTGHALSTVERHIKNNFISLHGDDLYSNEDFKNIANNKYSILAARAKNPQNFGVILEKNSFLIKIAEKPQKFISNLVNTGLYKLDKKIFPIIKNIKKSKRNEYELTAPINKFAENHPISCVLAAQWLPIGYPLDLLKADKILRKNKNIIGKNSKILGRIRNSSVGSNCIIKGDVRNSIIMDNTIIDEDSAVEDSIIGENVSFSGKAYRSVIADNVKAKDVVLNNEKNK